MGDDRQAADAYAAGVELRRSRHAAEFAEAQIPGLRDWWVGRAYAACVVRSGQSAAVEKRSVKRSRANRGGTDICRRAGPRMLLAFLLDGQGKESLALSEWRSMVTPPAEGRVASAKSHGSRKNRHLTALRAIARTACQRARRDSASPIDAPILTFIASPSALCRMVS